MFVLICCYALLGLFGALLLRGAVEGVRLCRQFPGMARWGLIICAFGMAGQAPRALRDDLGRIFADVIERMHFIWSSEMQAMLMLVAAVSLRVGDEQADFAMAMQLLTCGVALFMLALLDVAFIALAAIKERAIMTRLPPVLTTYLPQPIPRPLDSPFRPPRHLLLVA